MKKYLSIALLLSSLLISCEKVLNEKSDRSLKIPHEIADLHALLDNTGIFNNVALGLGEICSDNVEFTEQFMNGRNEFEQNMYLWRSPIMPVDGLHSEAWNQPYLAIYTANVILEQAEKLNPKNSGEVQELEHIKGRAAFLRAYYHLALLSTWRGPYIHTKKDELGIPIRTQSDINAPNKATTIGEGYAQIESDIIWALDRLPHTTQLPTEANRAAGYALASRFYLMKGDLEKTKIYADSSLILNANFMDFNEMDTSPNNPIPPMNQEVLFHVFWGITLVNRAMVEGVPDELYDLYKEEDIRKKMFFRFNANGSPRFKGAYNGSLGFFSGLTTTEVLLNRIEALIRLNRDEEARKDLLKFLKFRYNKDYNLEEYLSTNKLKELIKSERRKELLYRDLRWVDIQRYYHWDNDPVMIERYLGGEVYKFKAEMFALPYPDNFLYFNEAYR